MIIPVRCFTCGKVLADKWRKYEALCSGIEDKADADAQAPLPPPQQGAPGKTKRGQVLDSLGITNGCCRTIMLTHVDMSLII